MKGKNFGEILTPKFCPAAMQPWGTGLVGSQWLGTPAWGLCCGLGNAASFPKLIWKGLLQGCVGDVCHECVMVQIVLPCGCLCLRAGLRWVWISGVLSLDASVLFPWSPCICRRHCDVFPTAELFLLLLKVTFTAILIRQDASEWTFEALL